MKRYGVGKMALQLMLAIIILGLASMASALQGGPDKFGYRYIDSHERSGPGFGWIHDVPANGRQADVSDLENNLGIKLRIGFPFNFYGVDYENIHIGGNGFITFSSIDCGGDNHVYRGESFPDSGKPNNIIAPFWSHLAVQV